MASEIPLQSGNGNVEKNSITEGFDVGGVLIPSVSSAIGVRSFFKLTIPLLL